jgi:uncharacterized protein
MKKYILLFCLFSVFVAQSQEKNVFDVSRKGTLADIVAIYKSNPDAINSLNENKSSPLILACYKGNVDVAKFLIPKVKDINYVSVMGTALMATVVNGNLEILQMLLQNKANPNLTDQNGVTALMYAVQFQNADMILLLLNNKADKNLLNNEGLSAFEYATKTTNDKIINLLK